MSLILDALKRADQERADNSEFAQWASQAAAPRQRPAWRWLPWLLIAVLAASLLALMPRDGLLRDTAADALPAPAQQPTASGAGEGRVSPDAGKQSPAMPDAVARLYREREQQLAQAAAASQSAASDAAPQQPARAEPLAAELAKTAVNPAHVSLPFIHQLAERERNRVPSIHFAQLRPAQPGAEPAVKLNERWYQAGQQLVDGLSLVAVYEDFIVLDYRGLRFRLGALNSWVNL